MTDLRRGWCAEHITPELRSHDFSTSLVLGAMDYCFTEGLIPPKRMVAHLNAVLAKRDEMERALGRPHNWRIAEQFRDEYESKKGRNRIDEQLHAVRFYARFFGYIDPAAWREAHQAHARRQLERMERARWQREQAKRKTALAPIRHQRRKLREGAATLTAIRKHLRDRQPLPPVASGPAKTSPTL